MHQHRGEWPPASPAQAKIMPRSFVWMLRSMSKGKAVGGKRVDRATERAALEDATQHPVRRAGAASNR
eukprot:8862686-Pyramimonas_sp.AAC.1